MQSSENPYEMALARIRKLKDTKPELRPLLDYYDAVLRAQSEAKAAFHPDLTGVDIELCKKRTAEGLPLLEPGDVKLDWDAFDDLFDGISRISQERAKAAGSADAWPSIAGREPEWHDGLLKGLLEDEALLEGPAGRAGVPLDKFTFLACQALAPFLERYADGMRQAVDGSARARGCCPVCGGEPLMGRLEEEAGKRFLQCHLCRTQWPFPRLECPFCGSDDQQSLRYFYDEEDPTCRVEVCDVCKAYLKTVDARRTGGEVSLLAENVATSHLDLVARREGFQRNTNRLLGL